MFLSRSRLVIEDDEDDKQDERDDIPCCRLIEVTDGKVSFGAPIKCEPNKVRFYLLQHTTLYNVIYNIIG